MPPKLKNGNPVRKHVTTACTPCRDAKAKCDGSKPSCKNCESKNKVCSYRQRDDKRNRIPIRIAVTLLAERVAFLSQLIRNNGLEVPEMNEADQDTLRSILQTLGLRCEGVRVGDQESSNSGAILPENERVISVASQVTNGQTNMTNTQRSDLGGRGDYNYTGNDLHAFCEAPDPQIPVEDVSEGTLLIDCDSANSTHIGPTQNGQIPNPLPGMSRMHDQDPTQPRPNEIPISGLPETDSDDEVVEQLSYRLGRVQVTHDGQLRYFGSTSNLTLLDALVSIGNPNSTSVQKDMQDTLENLKLDMQVEEAFEKHLLELYFAWQDPCLHVVNIEAFWKARLQNRYEDSNSQYYSRSLCAMGAAYEPKFHPDLVTFPRSLSEFFSDRAKTLLEAEIENPSLATVQTLVILSNYEASSTRDSRGWLYSGMAMRLAFDLGLHLDMIPYVEKGIISAEECETRRTVFWGAYLNEQFWGYYLGRSARSPMAGVTVRKPYWNDSYSTIHTAARWRAYGCPQVSIQSISNPIDMICGQWVSLYDLMLPATDVL
ncbi:uncharacterized protein N7446_008830 [Penicillium canescens]|uniref:uncharacterized protein n=1 Tax=Penicillium canescens TaxID=5083 RepID=UPI0026E0E507|nr:uncharacterized protein N7446_008830 [Penicillium canescens]KAJ6059247.1 hypothetical protein N7446_008830 [Penicillium canescens]